MNNIFFQYYSFFNILKNILLYKYVDFIHIVYVIIEEQSYNI